MPGTHRGHGSHPHRLAPVVVVALGGIAGCAQGDRVARVETGRFAAVFGGADVGRLPAGWTPLVTNGNVARTDWRVIADAGSPSGHCLALVRNENGRRQCNLCVYEGAVRADVDVHAMCQGDYGVGVVWRCVDADNYYVCRVNPAEGNFNLYKVVAGERVRLASGRLRRFIDDQWYDVRVRASGDEITCTLDGNEMFSVRDASLPGPGRVGVWTRADALGRFDRLEVDRISGPPRETSRGSAPVGVASDPR